MKQNNKKNILMRYAVIVVLFICVGIGVLFKLFNTTVVQAGEWNKRAKKEMSKLDTIAPERGNILSDNGNILACNLRVYNIFLDLRHKKIQDLPTLQKDSLAMLADSLDKYYPRRSDLNCHPDTFAKYSWHKKLTRSFDVAPDERTRALRIVRMGSLEDIERVKHFPFIRQFLGSRNTPLYSTEVNKRMYPFGKMAFRSIGRVNEDSVTGEIHGYSGLEAALDSLLYGKPGISKRVALNKGIGNWVTVKPVRGYDLRTTINIDLQDMLEEELYKICAEANAKWGTAVLMEVETGEIKAISNIELLKNGTYGEALNRAVLPFEPGSVLKPISLMVAFEDGLVKNVTDLVDCSPFMKTSDHAGGGMKNMKQVIETSSNTGIARVIFRGYQDHPEKYYDRLAEMGFFEPMKTGIMGECIPKFRRLVDKDSKGNNITMTARHLDLARQAYGYSCELPPLFTLAVYNAIANDGKFVRPHLLKGLIDENGRDSVVPLDYIRPQICSEATARKVRECIREVVWGNHGTARLVRDDRVEIAGKTGTAYPVGEGGYDRSKRRYAFCGFFPYDKPRYTCIALVLASGGTSANRTSGQVVKNMALKMYSRGMLSNSSDFRDKKTESNPTVAASCIDNTGILAGVAGVQSILRLKSENTIASGNMPDLKGYDAVSAVKILEQRGINVRLDGAGYVYSQSLPPNSPVRRGQIVTLKLRI